MFGLFGGKKKKITQFIEDGAVVIDVRTPAEYHGGHLNSSKNIPLDRLPASLGKLDKNKPVITCCASGMRSGSAARILKAEGFEVLNGGGWMSLQRYGL